MSYLIIQISICLIIAFLLGLLLGWLLSRSYFSERIRKSDDMWRKRKEAVKKERDDLKAKTRTLSDSLSENEEDRGRLRQELREARQEAVANQEELASLKNDLTNRDRTADSAENLSQQLQASRQELGDRDQTISELRSKLDAVQNDLKDRVSASDYEEAQTRFNQELHDRKQEITALQEELESLKNDHANHERTTVSIEELSQKLATVRGDLHTRDQTIGELRLKLEAAESALEDRAERLNQLEKDLKEAGASNNQQTLLFAELRAGTEEGKDSQAKIEEQLKAQLNEAQTALDRSQIELAACRKKGEQLAAELEVVHQQAKSQPLDDGLPAWVMRSRPEQVDDLKRIKGVGPVLNGMLNDLGIYQFKQIAHFTPNDVAWVSANLKAFKDRIVRDDWVSQAQHLQLDPGEKEP